MRKILLLVAWMLSGFIAVILIVYVPRSWSCNNLGAVEEMAYSPDGTSLVIVRHDGKTELWNIATGYAIYLVPIAAQVNNAWSVAFAPDGRSVLVGYGDGTARLWDASSGVLLHSLIGHNDHVWGVTYAPDNRTALTGSYDGTGKLWDVQTGQL